MTASFLAASDLISLWISLRLAAITVLILLMVGTPLAWWLASGRSKFRIVIEAVTALPLVLPPTVLGFYLLLFLGPFGWAGRTMLQLGLQPLSFTFNGLIVGSVLYSLPFVVQPLQNSFQAVGVRTMEVAATLRAEKDGFLLPADAAQGIATARAARVPD